MCMIFLAVDVAWLNIKVACGGKWEKTVLTAFTVLTLSNIFQIYNIYLLLKKCIHMSVIKQLIQSLYIWNYRIYTKLPKISKLSILV